MKYIAPKATIVELELVSIILDSIYCDADSYEGGDVWEDNAKTNLDFYA